MAEQDSSEKSEKATPHKLRESRKKGMVAKSQDMSSLLIMSAALLLMYAAGEQLILRSFEMCRQLFLRADKVDYHIGHLMSWLEAVFSQGMSTLAAYVVPLMLVAVLASLVQTGPVFSVFPIKPDFSKLNPVKGFKRVFSLKTLVELAKSLLKIASFGCVVYFTVLAFMPKFMGLVHRSPRQYIDFFLDNSAVLIFRLLMALLLIAILDFIFSRWDYQKKLKMSKQELKDEHKRHEGDPLIKQKRKEIANELKERSRSMANVPGADVIITNPTHFAVALKYDRKVMVAPKTVGKGAGQMAAKIRELAARYGVPIISNPPLARSLYKNTKVDGYIHQDDYIEVAKIMKEVYARKKSYA